MPPRKKSKPTEEIKRKAGVNLPAHEVGHGMVAIADALKNRDTGTNIAGILQSDHEQQVAVTVQMFDM